MADSKKPIDSAESESVVSMSKQTTPHKQTLEESDDQKRKLMCNEDTEKMGGRRGKREDAERKQTFKQNTQEG